MHACIHITVCRYMYMFVYIICIQTHECVEICTYMYVFFIDVCIRIENVCMCMCMFMSVLRFINAFIFWQRGWRPASPPLASATSWWATGGYAARRHWHSGDQGPSSPAPFRYLDVTIRSVAGELNFRAAALIYIAGSSCARMPAMGTASATRAGRWIATI